MDVLVKISDDKDLLVVANRLASEELLRLFECRIMFDNLVCLSVEDKAVRDPAIIASEDQNF